MNGIEGDGERRPGVSKLRALLSRSRAGSLIDPDEHAGGEAFGVIQWVREQLVQDPTNPDLKDWLASLLYTSNRIDEARRLLVDLITNGHSTPLRQYQLGCCLAIGGRIREAMNHWEEVVMTAPGTAAAQKARERLHYLREYVRTV